MHKFKIVTQDEIIKVVKSLENKQSTLDPISCELVKKCQFELLPALSNIINSSLNLGHFPNLLKTAIVTPIIKSTSLHRPGIVKQL